MKNEIVLIRGLPGSGKSTMAKTFENHLHFEADMFFEIDGVYVYDPAKIKDAHNWCFASAKSALEQGKNVVISNTFVKLWEMRRYIDLGFPFKVVELHTKWHSIHGIPDDKIQLLAKNWQELPPGWNKETVR
jgi:predicted kinase